MKIQPAFSIKRGFTLIELMVAMAITTIIVTVLVSITSMATDTWNRSRAELRSSRQAKAMIDTMARDLESLVTRRGTYTDATKAIINPEWLSAVSTTEAPGGNMKSANSSKLIFFAASTDRYDGNIGNQDAAKGKKDDGGDVSGVAYKLLYKDPVDKEGTIYKTFVFNRLLIDPKPAFDYLLGKPDLEAALALPPVPYNNTSLEDQDAFVCENVYQFTTTFHIEVNHVINSTTSQLITVPVSIGNSGTLAKSLKVNGTGITTTAVVSGVTADELKSGRLVAIELSITVLSDAAIDQIRRPSFNDKQIPTMLLKHAFNYSKRIQVPGN